MKSTERHRLKENELAVSVACARDAVETYRSRIIAVTVAVVVLAAAAFAFVAWRNSRDDSARTMFADAVTAERAPVAQPPAPGQTPPAAQPGSYPDDKSKREAVAKKFLAAADAYPSTEAGIAARYHAAATLVLLGRTGDAIPQYEQVIDRAGSSLYGEMARLGIADAQALAGEYDKAIATYKTMADAKDSRLPVEGILMQLGRAYALSGKSNDAKQTFQRVMDQFPQSPYAQAAKRELDQIKG